MPEELEDEFGDILKKARAGLGYAAEELSEKTGIAADQLYDMEAYRLKPSAEQVRAIAGTLNLDGDRLLAIAEDSYHPQVGEKVLLGVILERIRVPINGYSSNCYVLGCPETGEAAVVDPGGAVEDILALLRKRELKLSSVLVTHGHSDHVGGLSEIIRRFAGIAVISPCERVHGPYVRHADDGDEFSVGSLPVKALITPGHTEESTCYYVNGSICFVGDTLFAGSVGGAHGGPGSYLRELDSVKSKIFTLPDDTLILPGHGPATTVGEEKRHNPFF